jgi:hypothetical protein
VHHGKRTDPNATVAYCVTSCWRNFEQLTLSSMPYRAGGKVTFTVAGITATAEADALIVVPLSCAWERRQCVFQ